MSVANSLLALANKQPEDDPVAAAPQPSWVQSLIDKRYQPNTERLKRTPVGFDFKRDPFDPSSYYKQLGSYRDISRLATNVTNQEAANKEQIRLEKEQAANQAAINAALKNVNPNFQYNNDDGSSVNYSGGVSKKYGLKGIAKDVSKAADYWGSKYGIKTIGGRGPGSVPGSDHPKGLALDFMINNVKNGKARGTALANDLIKNYKAWNIKYIIWYHYIWHPGRGWSKYSGPSPHTDHVHASFNS
jgi:hypothetical protein